MLFREYEIRTFVEHLQVIFNDEGDDVATDAFFEKEWSAVAVLDGMDAFELGSGTQVGHGVS